jgi:hypothetical protein
MPLLFTLSLTANPSLSLINFSFCALSNEWVRTFSGLLDRDSQDGHLAGSDVTATLAGKVARNNERFRRHTRPDVSHASLCTTRIESFIQCFVVSILKSGGGFL